MHPLGVDKQFWTQRTLTCDLLAFVFDGTVAKTRLIVVCFEHAARGRVERAKPDSLTPFIHPRLPYTRSVFDLRQQMQLECPNKVSIDTDPTTSGFWGLSTQPNALKDPPVVSTLHVSTSLIARRLLPPTFRSGLILSRAKVDSS